MNLDTVSAQALTQFLDWLKGAGSFVATEAPQIAQEYVGWYRVEASVSLSVFVFLLAASLVFFFKKENYLTRKHLAAEADSGSSYDRYHGGWSDFNFVAKSTSLVAAFLFFWGVAVQTGQIAKSYYAPRVVIIEGIRDLLTPRKTR